MVTWHSIIIYLKELFNSDIDNNQLNPKEKARNFFPKFGFGALLFFWDVYA